MYDLLDFKLVTQLIEYHDGPAYLKDALSGKFVFSNQKNLNIFNLQESNLIGKTVWDLDQYMHEYWGDNATQEQQTEEELISNLQPINKKNCIWLNASGYIWSHNLSKFPILNTHHQIYAILALYQDLTQYMSLWDLYQSYCMFYEDKTTRIVKFLEHIHIIEYFNELPTHCELLVLILKESMYPNKEIALKINVQLTTIESHINKLNQKVTYLPNLMHQMSKWRIGATLPVDDVKLQINKYQR